MRLAHKETGRDEEADFKAKLGYTLLLSKSDQPEKISNVLLFYRSTINEGILCEVIFSSIILLLISLNLYHNKKGCSQIKFCLAKICVLFRVWRENVCIIFHERLQLPLVKTGETYIKREMRRDGHSLTPPF